MTNPIGNVGGPLPLPPPGNSPFSTGGNTAPGVDFQNLLLNSLTQTNASQQQAHEAIETSLAGGDISQVEVFSSMKKAELSLRMMTQIRNKLLSAYNEIKDMQM